MAIYSLTTTPASRSNGRNALAMAAYRAAEILRDDRTGEIFDYRRKRGVIYSRQYFPDGVAPITREKLWNMAEAAEGRKDARIAREYRVAYPHELPEKERLRVGDEFARYLVNRYNIAVDRSDHAASNNGDERNLHGHFLTTTRMISVDGFIEKSDIERSCKYCFNHRLPNSIEQINEIREEWENICNRALERTSLDIRISAKSYKEQNIDIVPTVHLGKTCTSLERAGIHTIRGDMNREIKEVNKLRSIERASERLHTALAEIVHQMSELMQQAREPVQEPERVHEESLPDWFDPPEEEHPQAREPVQEPAAALSPVERMRAEMQRRVPDPEREKVQEQAALSPVERMRAETQRRALEPEREQEPVHEESLPDWFDPPEGEQPQAREPVQEPAALSPVERMRAEMQRRTPEAERGHDDGLER